MKRPFVALAASIVLAIILLGIAQGAERQASPGPTPTGVVYPVLPTATAGTPVATATVSQPPGTPATTAVPATRTPWPTLGPLPTLAPPPTPVTTTAQISRDEALAIFMAKYPKVQADLLAGRVLTVTATLETHGNSALPAASLLYHPALPVWIITVRFAARTQWFGPAGRETPFTFDAERHEMSALDGRILGSWLVASGAQ